ncbi:MAG TPA: hypothetical protein P5048_01745 [Chlamydiales bacterium]|nr:hypothetical protein [Chlamydiales bacterium]
MSSSLQSPQDRLIRPSQKPSAEFDISLQTQPQDMVISDVARVTFAGKYTSLTVHNYGQQEDSSAIQALKLSLPAFKDRTAAYEFITNLALQIVEHSCEGVNEKNLTEDTEENQKLKKYLKLLKDEKIYSIYVTKDFSVKITTYNNVKITISRDEINTGIMNHHEKGLLLKGETSTNAAKISQALTEARSTLFFDESLLPFRKEAPTPPCSDLEYESDDDYTGYQTASAPPSLTPASAGSSDELHHREEPSSVLTSPSDWAKSPLTPTISDSETDSSRQEIFPRNFTPLSPDDSDSEDEIDGIHIKRSPSPRISDSETDSETEYYSFSASTPEWVKEPSLR